MPSIRIYASPNLPEIDETTKSVLTLRLKNILAGNFHINPIKVEVLWVDITYAHNEVHLGVEVIYTVKPGIFEPEPETISSANEAILEAITSLHHALPKGFNEVSSWIRPQHEAAFELRRLMDKE